jgi:hypothetical protein
LSDRKTTTLRPRPDEALRIDYKPSSAASALIERQVGRTGEVESEVINRLVLRVSAIDEVEMADREDDVAQNGRGKRR